MTWPLQFPHVTYFTLLYFTLLYSSALTSHAQIKGLRLSLPHLALVPPLFSTLSRGWRELFHLDKVKKVMSVNVGYQVQGYLT